MSKKVTKTKEATAYELRDVVLAKIRGYPSWPAMVVDPDGVPRNVLKERPAGKKTSFHCVRFFPAGDYAWVVNKDMSKLKTHEIEAYINEPSKKSGDLLEGYKIALDPSKWLQDLEDARIEMEEEEANAEVDELDGEEEAADEDEDKPKTKKRKRESEPGEKKKAKPKKEKVEKAANGEGKKKGAAASKGKKSSKSKALVESEDEGDGAPAGPSKKEAPPPAKKAKKEEKKEEEEDSALANDKEALKIKNWRHSFQRHLLGKAPPKDEELPMLDDLFTTVEQYDGFTIEYLTYSKIGKVMRHIAALTDDKAPKDNEYKFRERAKSLVDKWQAVLNASKAANTDLTANGHATAIGDAAKDSHNTRSHGHGKKGGEKATTVVNGEEKPLDEVIAAVEQDLQAKPEQTSAEADASMADVTMNEDA